MAVLPKYDPKNLQEPPISRYLFSNLEISWVWLILRVYVGWQWVQAGLHKIEDPKWVETGTALQGYWQNAVLVPPEVPRAAIAFDWYRAFLQGLLDGGHYVWFAKLIAFGEFAVGLALIVGAFVGIAAFFGAFMNFNFIMAGSASTNPLLFAIAILLVLAWKTAGYWGVDRWLLPALGTPWQPSELFGRKPRTVEQQR